MNSLNWRLLKMEVRADKKLECCGDLKLGLFAYPVLQTADVLLYK